MARSVPQKAVQKGGFPRVRPPQDGHARSLAEHPAGPVALFQGEEVFLDSAESFPQLLSIHRGARKGWARPRLKLVGKIDGRLQMGPPPSTIRSQASSSFFRQPPVHQGQRRPGRPPRLGRDEVRHRLGLDEIDLALQKGPPGELAGSRGQRPRIRRRLEDGLDHRGAAVAVEFRHVLAGERSRLPHQDGHPLVDHLAAGPDEAPEEKAACLKSRFAPSRG